MSHFEPANDNDDQPPPERRGQVRRRVLLTGKIVYPHNGFTADCTVRDLSEGGARIGVSPAAIFADPFLIVVRQAVVHHSLTVWRNGQHAGLSFLKTVDLSGQQPLYLRPIQRVWLELALR